MTPETIRRIETERPITIIADNGGGVTIQTEAYAHYYDRGETAAIDILAYLDGSDPDAATWEGHDEDARIDTDSDDFRDAVRNRGYEIIDLADVAAINRLDHVEFGANTRAIWAVLVSAIVCTSCGAHIAQRVSYTGHLCSDCANGKA